MAVIEANLAMSGGRAMTATTSQLPAFIGASVNRFVAFLETGASDGLFAPDVFADVTLPLAGTGAGCRGAGRPAWLHAQGRGAVGGRRGAVVLPQGVPVRPRRRGQDHRAQHLLHRRL